MVDAEIFAVADAELANESQKGLGECKPRKAERGLNCSLRTIVASTKGNNPSLLVNAQSSCEVGLVYELIWNVGNDYGLP